MLNILKYFPLPINKTNTFSIIQTHYSHNFVFSKDEFIDPIKIVFTKTLSYNDSSIHANIHQTTL